MAIAAVSAVEPDGPVDAVPPRFTWWAEHAEPPFTLIVYDAAFREVGRQPGIRECSVEPDAALVSELERGGVFYWAVEYRAASDGAVARPTAESAVVSAAGSPATGNVDGGSGTAGQNGTKDAPLADPKLGGRVLRSAVTRVRIP